MNRTNFAHVVIGIDDQGTIYTLENVFEHSPDFRGAVGSTFEAVSPEYVAHMSDIENVKEYLSNAGYEQEITDDIAEEYVRYLEFAGQDDSYSSHWDTIKTTAGIADDWTLTCTGGGRIFSRDIQWKQVFNQELLDLALSFETK